MVPAWIILVLLFHDSSHYDYYWIIITRPIWVWTFILLEKYIAKTKVLLANVFPCLILFFGVLTTIENLSYQEWKLIELWAMNYVWMFILISFWCLQFKKIALKLIYLNNIELKLNKYLILSKNFLIFYALIY